MRKTKPLRQNEAKQMTTKTPAKFLTFQPKSSKVDVNSEDESDEEFLERTLNFSRSRCEWI
jgi:hypothetical protein